MATGQGQQRQQQLEQVDALIEEQYASMVDELAKMSSDVSSTMKRRKIIMWVPFIVLALLIMIPVIPSIAAGRVFDVLFWVVPVVAVCLIWKFAPGMPLVKQKKEFNKANELKQMMDEMISQYRETEIL